MVKGQRKVTTRVISGKDKGKVTTKFISGGFRSKGATTKSPASRSSGGRTATNERDLAGVQKDAAQNILKTVARTGQVTQAQRERFKRMGLTTQQLNQTAVRRIVSEQVLRSGKITPFQMRAVKTAGGSTRELAQIATAKKIQQDVARSGKITAHQRKAFATTGFDPRVLSKTAVAKIQEERIKRELLRKETPRAGPKITPKKKKEVERGPFFKRKLDPDFEAEAKLKAKRRAAIKDIAGEFFKGAPKSFQDINKGLAKGLISFGSNRWKQFAKNVKVFDEVVVDVAKSPQKYYDAFLKNINKAGNTINEASKGTDIPVLPVVAVYVANAKTDFKKNPGKAAGSIYANVIFDIAAGKVIDKFLDVATTSKKLGKNLDELDDVIKQFEDAGVTTRSKTKAGAQLRDLKRTRDEVNKILK